MKFCDAASWSNLSAQIPATNHIAPSNADPKKAKMNIQIGASKGILANHMVTINTPKPTHNPRIMAAPT